MKEIEEIEAKNLAEYIDPMCLLKEPAIALASDGERTNGLTIAWGSFGSLWNRYSATVYVHRSRFSKEVFDKAEYFAICYFDEEFKDVLKYFGTVSGRDEDKMANCGLTAVYDDVAPYFAECKAVILCKVMGRCDFDPESCCDSVSAWYEKDGVHTQYFGEIVKILVND